MPAGISSDFGNFYICTHGRMGLCVLFCEFFSVMLFLKNWFGMMVGW